jgi:capsular exopolysaccharide synthesis family protein
MEPVPGERGAPSAGRDVVPAAQAALYARAVRRRWWVVLLATGLAVAAAFAVARGGAHRTYDATATVLLTNSEPVDTLLGTSGTHSLDPERDLNTGVGLVTLDRVAEQVRRDLGLSTSAQTLLTQVRAAAVGTSNLVAVTARDAQPALAARLANAFAREYIAFRQRSAQAQYVAAAGLAQAQLASLPPTLRASPRGVGLAHRIQELQVLGTLQTGGVQLVGTATPPTAPVPSKLIFTLVVAGLAGLFVGSLLAIGLDAADGRLRDENEVEALVGRPVVATVPRSGRRRGGWAQSEAYATVAVSLSAGDPGVAPRTIMFVSGDEDSGKTTLTLGVARALAAMGRRVVAVEADLRRPSFERLTGLAPSDGLVGVLTRRTRLADALVDLPAPPGEELFDDPPCVLPAGGTVANPHALLASVAMAELLDEIRGEAELVLIDTPPLGAVSDAVSLVRSVDLCVLVVRLDGSTKDGVRRALRLLGNAGIAVAGVVVLGVSDFGRYPTRPSAGSQTLPAAPHATSSL